MTCAFNIPRRGPFRPRFLTFGLLSILALLWTGACVQSGGDQPTGGELTGTLSLNSNIRLSGEQTYTIVYSASDAATNVTVFYVEVASTDVGAATIGDEVVIGTNLPTGTNKTVALSTASIPLGLYRVGLHLMGSTGSPVTILSEGTFQIVELPTPQFTMPNQNLTIQPGTAVQIRATVGDPENAVQWRLFYIDVSTPTTGIAPDMLGTQITTGSANEVIVTWNTASVPLGQYRIGISVTDSGRSIADAVDAGLTDTIQTILAGPDGGAPPGSSAADYYTIEFVAEAPEARPPSIVVSDPSTDITLFAGGSTLIRFEVTFLEGAEENQTISVFYDVDGEQGTGDEHTIASDLPKDTTEVAFSASLISEGDTVHIGVVADDGKNAPVTRYAEGTISFGTPADADLVVTQPNSPVTRRPGEIVNVSWQLRNVPPTAGGTVDVFMRATDEDGDPTGPEIPIREPSPLTTTSAQFETSESGRFLVSVRAIFNAAPAEPVIADAPALVVVSTLPGIVWLGDLTKANPPVRGAVFEGVNFEDNAGSAFAGGADFDDDGNQDFILVSRYAKPEFINPAGVGEGEAYLVRGSSTLAGKRFNLNAVSTATLPGMVFTGIPILNPTGSEETYGIGSVFISSDADNDGVGEIWFGVPFANSRIDADIDNIQREGQFGNGGVVCVSSKNSRVRNTFGSDVLGARINLNEVGMHFNANRVGPEPRDADGTENVDMANLCSGESLWLADRLEYFEGECDTGDIPPPPYQFDGCVDRYDPMWEGGDDQQDTIIEPQHGFSPVLANNFLMSSYIRGAGFPCSNTALVNDNDCPSCLYTGDDTSGCNGFCEPDYVEFVAPLSGLIEHTTLEPLDVRYGDPNDRYCEIATDTGGFEYSGAYPLLPEPPECQVQHDAIHAAIANPLGILNVDSNLAYVYDYNKSDGLARSPTFTGFYVDEYVAGDEIVTNEPVQPYGMRIIGRPPTTDVFSAGNHEELSLFGTSITQVGNSIIISAPQRDAIEGFDAIDFVTPGEIENAGVIYTFDNFAYWEPVGFDLSGNPTRIPPKPHMFLAGGGGNTGFVPALHTVPPGTTTARWDLAVDREFETKTMPPVIVGGVNEQIEEVRGIGDFDGDSRGDFAVGSPRAGSGDGAVYVVFRRAPSLEGDFILEKLALALDDPERLNGLLITGDAGAGEGFGRVLASGVDFNGDGVGDIIVGNPNGNAGTGEVVIIFARMGTLSPLGGFSVEELISRGQAARILGDTAGSDFGFTVASAGDVDGDGKNDLLIAAPAGTPRFDPNPFDDQDELTQLGLDRNLDGQQDDVTGPLGVPDGQVTDADDLVHAGLVYLILSGTDARDWDNGNGDYEISISDLGRAELPGVIFVGENGERTAQSGTPIDGDYLGGGNAGDTAEGGVAIKSSTSTTASIVGGDRGRGVGLGTAGDVDNDGRADFLLGALLADPRVNPRTGEGVRNGGEAYLIFGFAP